MEEAREKGRRWVISTREEMRQAVIDASGLPATTMSDAVIDGLNAVGGHRVAVATAYNDEVNDRLRTIQR